MIIIIILIINNNCKMEKVCPKEHQLSASSMFFSCARQHLLIWCHLSQELETIHRKKQATFSKHTKVILCFFILTDGRK